MERSSEDEAMLADMRERESRMKRAQRATDAVTYRERRFRAGLLFAAALVFGGLAALLAFAVFRTAFDHSAGALVATIIVVLSTIIGFQTGGAILRSRAGGRALSERSRHLESRYAEELRGARRWRSFYYKGEDISQYVPQILYFLDSDQRFSSIDEALAFAKESRRSDGLANARALAEFDRIASSSHMAVITSVGADGQPSARLMCFATTETPGVWLVPTSPETPKVSEFDAGRVAVVTLPAQGGGTISSNEVSIARAPFTLERVAGQFDEQIPGFMDGVSEAEARDELVYELTFRSARVENQSDHAEVDFPKAS